MLWGLFFFRCCWKETWFQRRGLNGTSGALPHRFLLFRVCTRGISGTELYQCLIIGELYVRRACLELFLSECRQYCCRLSVSGFLQLVLSVALMGHFFVMGSSFIVWGVMLFLIGRATTQEHFFVRSLLKTRWVFCLGFLEVGKTPKPGRVKIDLLNNF